MATRSPKRAVELAGHGRRQRDLRHQHQRAAACGQRGVDGVEIDLGFARAGDAVQQERAELAAWRSPAPIRSNALRCAVLSTCGARMGALRMATGSGVSVTSLFARQRARRLAGVVDRGFEVLQIVRAGMQREKGQQFALGFRQSCPGGSAAGECNPQASRKARAADRGRAGPASAAIQPLRSSDFGCDRPAESSS